MNLKTIASWLAALAWPGVLFAQAPPPCWPHCITYQGVLMQPGPDPVAVSNGVYRLKFRLYDSPTGGVPIELKCGDCADGTNTVVSVDVRDGTFTTLLKWPDDTPVYPQLPKWMEVMAALEGLWAAMQPRVPIVPVPFAHYARATHWTNTLGLPPGFADGVDNDTTYTAGVGLGLSQNIFSVNFAGSGTSNAVARSDHFHSGFMPGFDADLLDGMHATNFAGFAHSHDDRYWKLTGNDILPNQFLGTLGLSGNQPLVIRVNSQRSLLLDWIAGTASPNLIGGHWLNNAAAGVSGATIGGGGVSNSPNVIRANFGTIGGGSDNVIQSNASYAAIPGGKDAQARNYGQLAYAGGALVSSGDAQTSVHVLRGRFTGAATNELFLDLATSARMVLPADATWAYDILIVARNSSTYSGAWHVRGVIERNGSNTMLDGTQLKDTLNNDFTGEVFVEADNTAEALVIKVWNGTSITGLGEVRWVATVRTAEVTFP